VATTVTYTRSFSYSIDSFSGEPFPGLEVRVSRPDDAGNAVDLIAHLDTGAVRSVFDGSRIVSALGIDLMAGREISIGSIIGFALTARIHRLELSHPDLGSFTPMPRSAPCRSGAISWDAISFSTSRSDFASSTTLSSLPLLPDIDIASGR
jgi:hypothetical protein